jgi:hypothetical protein
MGYYAKRILYVCVWGVPLVFIWIFGQKRSEFAERDQLGVEVAVLEW